MDLIERQTLPSGGGQGGGTTVTAFPIYDAHGNNVASLTRSGTSFSIGDRRSYDAWGVVRAQQSGGDPKLRYCANLGHKQDDESGLVYMRARYYEPSSGRFVSEDPGMDGGNWFVYGANDPVGKIDSSGRSVEAFAFMWFLVIEMSQQVMENPSFKLLGDLKQVLKLIEKTAEIADKDDMEAFDLSATASEIDPELRDYEASRTFENLEDNKLEKLALETEVKWLIELGEDALDQVGMG